MLIRGGFHLHLPHHSPPSKWEGPRSLKEKRDTFCSGTLFGSMCIAHPSFYGILIWLCCSSASNRAISSSCRAVKMTTDPPIPHPPQCEMRSRNAFLRSGASRRALLMVCRLLVTLLCAGQKAFIDYAGWVGNIPGVVVIRDGMIMDGLVWRVSSRLREGATAWIKPVG